MNNSDTLLKATINRLTARLSEKIIDTATKVALQAQEAPEKLKEEWEILKKEIYQEAERLENESSPNNESPSNPYSSPESNNTTEKIDLIRRKIADISEKFEPKD
tara:strand:- start:662 stop:976 length:315 start_codon:yes stop_codon:yes gene_type:complete